MGCLSSHLWLGFPSAHVPRVTRLDVADLLPFEGSSCSALCANRASCCETHAAQAGIRKVPNANLQSHVHSQILGLFGGHNNNACVHAQLRP